MVEHPAARSFAAITKTKLRLLSLTVETGA